MSNLSQFFGGNKPPKSIINAFSNSGFSASGAVPPYNIKVVAIGAVTSNVLKTVLSVSGAGQIDFLSLTTVDTTSRTLRAKVTIDGTVVFDSTSAVIASVNYGFTPLGACSSSGGTPPALQPTFFNSSLLVEVASSLTETDKANVGYNYRTF